MAKQVHRSAPKKSKRGRPVTTGKGILIVVRFHQEFLSGVDSWRAKQESDVSRPDAIRRLAEIGLQNALSEAKGPKQRSPKARSKAQEFASTQLDKLIDPSATDEERETRKRRLLKGPREFREIRNEVRSKSKS
jgi:hypothetical protein